MRRLPIVVLLSGHGSTLQALLDARSRGELDVDLRAVISDRPGAYGLERARRSDVAAEVLPRSCAHDRAGYDAALATRVEAYGARLVVLAGYMRILGPPFLEHYEGATINIHPSLLPAFPGLDTYARALTAGERLHGSSIHFVTTELDGGPLIAQARVAIREDEDAETLKQRTQAAERRLYPTVVQWFARGRVELRGAVVHLDGLPLAGPVVFDAPGEPQS